MYSKAEIRWGVRFPADAKRLLDIPPQTGVLVSGRPLSVPWPPLTPDEIASVADVAEDWELPHGYVPVMGEFHNLVCLVFAGEREPGVALLNDERDELVRFSSVSQFVAALKPLAEEPQSVGTAIKSKSWLGF